MESNWTRTTEPSRPVVSVQDVRGGQARLTQTNEDAQWYAFIRTATDKAESYLGRGLFTQVNTLWLDDWASEVPLPMAAPLLSIDSVHYYDASGSLTALSSSYYIIDSSSEPAKWLKAPNVAFPALQADRRGGRVRIVYTVGWDNVDNIPESIKQGIRIYATALDEARNGVDVDLRLAESIAQSCWSARVFVPPVGCA